MLALPVAMQMFLQSLLGMADVGMVSGLGEAAVAAVGLAAKLHFLLIVVMAGIAIGGSTLIAQHVGAKQTQKTQLVFAVNIIVGCILSLPLIGAFLGAPLWATLINPDPEVAKLTGSYLVITAPVLLFTQIILIYEGALRSYGNTTVPLAVAFVAVVLNVLLNYVLIFGHLGAPALGVMGAAWGTLVARGVQAGLLIIWSYWRPNPFALNGMKYKQAFNLKDIGYFVRFTWPMAINFCVWGLGNTVYHVLIGFSGTNALAVMGVMVPVESAFYALFFGLASACAVMIGQSLGAGHADEAWRLQRFFSGVMVVTVVLVSGCLWGVRSFLHPLLHGLTDTALSMFFSVLGVFCLVVPIKVMNLLMVVGVLRAGGDNAYCLTIDTMAMWVVGLPVFAICVYLGVDFIWLYLLMSLEDAFKICPNWFRIRQGRWVRNLT